MFVFFLGGVVIYKFPVLFPFWRQGLRMILSLFPVTKSREELLLREKYWAVSIGKVFQVQCRRRGLRSRWTTS